MTDAIAGVAFDHVSKRFRRGGRADSLRDLLPALGRRLLRRGSETGEASDFWALRDLSFTVVPGEVLGIIGPNGAGKSTVLRLLTGLLQPDSGTVAVHGRIGALIELAAGFHPDLTGRENVFLQGAILGLSRADIARRFDEIVDFAEVEAFLDTPVKHYSSGMNARLGFAIAAHCEPDVLLVDEVLSVGDRAFQAKAYARLAHEVKRGIPVVVVSHQLDRIATLCQRAMLLSHGAVAFEGPARECVAAYIEGVHLAAESTFGACPLSLGAMHISGQAPEVWSPGARVTLRLEGIVRQPEIDDVVLGVRVWTLPDEARLGSVYAPAHTLAMPSAGRFEIDVAISLNLAPGLYRLQAAAWYGPTSAEWAHGGSLLIEVGKLEGSAGNAWLAPVFGSSSP